MARADIEAARLEVLAIATEGRLHLQNQREQGLLMMMDGWLSAAEALDLMHWHLLRPAPGAEFIQNDQASPASTPRRDSFLWLPMPASWSARDRALCPSTEVSLSMAGPSGFSRVFIVTLMNFGLFAEVGSRHLQGVMEALLEDEVFLGEAANDLFATMLYAMLGFHRWPDQIRKLHERHGKHPMVPEVARRWALRRYVEGDLPEQVQTRLILV